MIFYKKNLIGLSILLLFLTHSILAQSTSINEISKLLKDWSLSDPTFSHSNFSFSLRGASKGNVLLDHRAEKSLVPASNLKLFTTISALEILGKEFRFKTTLEYSGTIDDQGTLNGNIYLIGGGDPTLGSAIIKAAAKVETLMDTILAKLRFIGIKKIKGNIYADGNFFPFNQVPDGWTWGDVGNYYGAGAGGLNINDNLFKIYFKPGLHLGDSAEVVRVEPEIPGLVLVNMVLTGPEGSGDHASVYGGAYAYYRYMNGTVPKGKDKFAIKASIPDPAYFAAQKVYTTLKDAGIPVDGKPFTLGPGTGKKPILKKVYTFLSPTVSEIVQETNMQSVNLFAESLFKRVAINFSSQFSYDSASLAMKGFWISKGMDVQGFNMTDGCGLSFTNTLTANQLTFLLDYAKSKPYFNIFYRSLPTSGTSGSLSRITKGTIAEGKIHAKTGTQTRVSCYSGYINNSKGELFPFSLLINNYAGTPAALSKKVEQLFLLLAKL